MPKYAIISHPTSGRFSPKRKERMLVTLAEILEDCDRKIHVLDTLNLKEFKYKIILKAIKMIY